MYSLAEQTKQGDLWLRDLVHGAAPKRFTYGPYSAYAPVWSPDGTAIVFTAFPADQLYRKTVPGGKEDALPATGTNTYPSSWSARANVIVYSQTGITTKDDLWLLPLDGEQKPKVFKNTPFVERHGQVSPDGKSIAYDSDLSGQTEIYVEPLAGGAQRPVSAAGGQYPRWRSDGRELYFITDDKKLMQVDVTPGPEPTFGPQQVLFTEPALAGGRYTMDYEVTDNGSQFLMLLKSGGSATSQPVTVITNWRKAYGK
jgi:Tol biopolymer transport system component